MAKYHAGLLMLNYMIAMLDGATKSRYSYMLKTLPPNAAYLWRLTMAKTAPELLAEIRERRNNAATGVGYLWNDIDVLLDAVEWQRGLYHSVLNYNSPKEDYDCQLAARLARKGGAR